MNHKAEMVGSTLGSLGGKRRHVQYKEGQVCSVCLFTVLNRYNKTGICSVCTVKINNKFAEEKVDSNLAGRKFTFKARKRKALKMSEYQG